MTFPEDNTPEPQIHIPDFQDEEVLKAIQRDDEARAERSAALMEDGELSVQSSELDPNDAPLVTYPQDTATPPHQSTAILNVMHNGAPALRQFTCGPAYEPS